MRSFLVVFGCLLAGCSSLLSPSVRQGGFAWSRVSTRPDLYVAKSGTDGPACGACDHPCRTIAGAHAIIRANNDNGFATCTDQPDRGCGRCVHGRAAGRTCNEPADCPGGTCSAATCSDSPRTSCVDELDCTPGATCSIANPSSRCANGGCAGQLKEYRVHVGAGRHAESVAGANAPPSPGFVTYTGRGAMLYGVDPCTMDLSGRQSIRVEGLSIQNWGDGDALCTRGGSFSIGVKGVSLVHWGKGWDFNATGPDNRTITLDDITTFGFTHRASSNSVHFESWPVHCRDEPSRNCLEDEDCAAGPCDGPPSADLGIQNSFIQPGTAGGVGAVVFDGRACGTNFNLFLDDVVIQAADATGVVVRQVDCDPGTPWYIRDGLMVTARDVRILGNSTLAGYGTPAVSLAVGRGAMLAVVGPLTYNACIRDIPGELVYEDGATGISGGASHLGVLACRAPPSPRDGELWYSAETGEFYGVRRGRVVRLSSDGRSTRSGAAHRARMRGR
jgi:hypothetical protein